MPNRKFVVWQKKIYKFFKRKLVSFEEKDSTVNRGGGQLVPNEDRGASKRMATPEGKALASLLRYLNRSMVVHHSTFVETLQTFWKVPHYLWKEERNLKTVWVAAIDGVAFPKQSRGFAKSVPAASPQPTTDGKDKQTKPKLPQDYSGISEQYLYMDKASPKLSPPLKRKPDWEESQKSGMEPPPAHRCRLSCPLPPPEFFPPEKTDFLPSYQSPYFKFATLRSVLLPETRQEDPQAKVYRMSTTHTSSEWEKLPPPPETEPKTLEQVKCHLNEKLYRYQQQSRSEEAPEMRALLFEPLNLTLNYDLVKAPTHIFKDEVLVQVSYSGVCGQDLFLTEGKMPCGDCPIILGQEISGTVYAAGKDVLHVEPGDSVAVDPFNACSVCKYCSRGQFSACACEGDSNSLGISKDGGWTEFVVVKKSQVHKVPEELGLDKAVLLVSMSCVLSAMAKLKLSQGMKILIQGLGLSGFLWASLLHSRGFTDVLVSDISDRKRTDFESLNLNYTFVPPEDLTKYAVDVVIECTGSPSSIERAFTTLNPNGQMCFFGRSDPLAEVRCVPFDIIQKGITIFGGACNSFYFPEAIAVATSLGPRYLDLDKLGVKVFELEDFREAIRMKKSEQVGKIVFRLDS